ncbi:MAG: hypothetical protein HY870_02930 [Chloroflexi bacterium]|nr:hypothetical protein [Chloroflexota bacterium]
MDTNAYIEGMLAEMFSRARRQWGSAIKAYWFYAGEACPGCLRSVDAMKYKGRDALSLNAFIYRERGILIGYLLCKRCAKHIFDAAKQHPYQQTPLHTTIEQNLIAAYQRHLASLDA